MGELELDISRSVAILYATTITYGNAADTLITDQIAEEIETMWNEPAFILRLNQTEYRLIFRINGIFEPTISPVDIYQNVDPRNNYFRVEEFVHGNISFVDGLGSNTGYFKLENLYKGSTTAAHEFGHTLGLPHPEQLDIRGFGIPGIMYPRGTLVDPDFQYNPSGAAGDSNNGGTMHPKFRKVLSHDIELLKLHKLRFENNKAVVGDFTSVWHPDHRTISPGELLQPGIMG